METTSLLGADQLQKVGNALDIRLHKGNVICAVMCTTEYCVSLHCCVAT